MENIFKIEEYIVVIYMRTDQVMVSALFFYIRKKTFTMYLPDFYKKMVITFTF